MKCPYCGREVKEGEVFCECGRPVSLGGSGASAPASSNPYLPEGVSLESLHKPAKQTGFTVFVFIIGLICVGVILFFVYKNVGKADITNEDAWQEISRSNYTMTIPSVLKDEKKRMLTLSGSTTQLLDFFSGKEAAVLINREPWDSDSKQVIAQYGLPTMKELVREHYAGISVNGQKAVPVERGDMICFELDLKRKNYIGKSDEVHEIYASFITEDAEYIVEVYCAKEDASKYKNTMYKWLDSFKTK